MIRKNALFCKLIRIKKSSSLLFNEFTAGYDGRSFLCPACHSRGNGVKHGSYQRNIVDFIGGKAAYSDIAVTRFLCRGCGHTHALLPDFIIPYSQYGLLFILRLLAESFAHLRPVASLCERFSVTVSMFYRWKKLFLSHKKLWLGAIADAEMGALGFLKCLASAESYSGTFGAPFCLLTSFSFLQSHHALAFYRRHLF